MVTAPWDVLEKRLGPEQQGGTQGFATIAVARREGRPEVDETSRNRQNRQVQNRNSRYLTDVHYRKEWDAEFLATLYPRRRSTVLRVSLLFQIVVLLASAGYISMNLLIGIHSDTSFDKAIRTWWYHSLHGARLFPQVASMAVVSVGVVFFSWSCLEARYIQYIYRISSDFCVYYVRGYLHII